MVRLPQSADPKINYDGTAAISPPFDEGFYLLLSGFAASVTAIQMNITYVYDVIPVSGSRNMCFMTYAKPGTATLQCIQNVAQRYPMLQRLGEEEATKMVGAMRAMNP